MAALYSLGDIQGFLMVGQAMFEIVAPTAQQPKLIEAEFVMPNASANVSISMGPSTTPGSALNSRATLPEDYSTTTTFLAVRTSWTRLPSTPSAYFRRGTFSGGTNSNGRLKWRFPRGVTIVGGGASLSIFCMSGQLGVPILANLVFEA